MTATVPTPIVSWEQVVSMSDPMHAPSRQRLRSLRDRANLSQGVRVVRRQGGRATGSHVYYSVLSALSAKAQESGETQAAADLGRAARELETWVSPVLREFLATRPITELSDAPFYEELVQRTQRALDPIKVDFVFMAGRIDFSDGELTRVIGGGGADDDRLQVDLPERLLQEIGAAQGDHVWIIRQIIGSAAVLSVLRAVPLDEEDQGMRYLQEGAGAPISPAEAEFFRNRPRGSLPTARVMRPAG